MPAFNLTHYAPLQQNPTWCMAWSAVQDLHWQIAAIKKRKQFILNIYVDVLTWRSVQIKDKDQKLWQRIDLW
jgi:hypothetical protein